MRARRDRPPIKGSCREDESGRRFREAILAKEGKDDPRLFFRTCKYECDADLGTLQFRTHRDRPGAYSILHRTPKRSNLEAGLTWQITRYEDDEPIGDMPYRSCELAINDAAKFGAKFMSWTRRKGKG